MKPIFIILIAVAIIAIAVIFLQPSKVIAVQPVSKITDTVITIVAQQDVSQSTLRNGVELITSQTFAPYFKETHKTISLYFGCISNQSARKLIHVYLQSDTLTVPTLSLAQTNDPTSENDAKIQYRTAKKKYQQDSAVYYTERNNLISQFTNAVDSELHAYANKLTASTDLITAISVAQKVFAFSDGRPQYKFLILNSDGQDSYKRIAKKIDPAITTILCNASGLQKTSIDSIITLTVESPEEAIQYSLTHSSPLKK